MVVSDPTPTLTVEENTCKSHKTFKIYLKSLIPVTEKVKHIQSWQGHKETTVWEIWISLLMQEHIQQVSLSELMTSWSHILPVPSPSMWQDRGATGRHALACACTVREWARERWWRWINGTRSCLWGGRWFSGTSAAGSELGAELILNPLGLLLF